MATIRPGTKCEVREAGTTPFPDSSRFLGFSLSRPRFSDAKLSDTDISELADTERTLRAWRKHHNLKASDYPRQYAWFETDSAANGLYTWAAYYWRGRWRLGTSADTFTLVPVA